MAALVQITNVLSRACAIDDGARSCANRKLQVICSLDAGFLKVRVFCRDFPGWEGTEGYEGIGIMATPVFGADAKRAFILKQGGEGVTVAEICRRSGIGRASYFNWKKKYDDLLSRRISMLSAEAYGPSHAVADLTAGLIAPSGYMDTL